MTKTTLVALFLVHNLLATPLVAVEEEPPVGVVVVEVEPGHAAERAGVLPGDLLLGWVDASRSSGDLLSPFDLEETEREQGPRGQLQILGMRYGKRFDAVLQSGSWGVRSHPSRSAQLEEAFLKGLRWLKEGAIDDALDLWRQAVADLRREDRHDLAVWLALESVAVLIGERRFAEAVVVVETAQRDAHLTHDLYIIARVKESLGTVLLRQNDPQGAMTAFQDALNLQRERDPTSLMTAALLNDLASLARLTGDLEAAARSARLALRLSEQRASGSMTVAESLTQLGIVYAQQGDLMGGAELFERALAIRKQHNPSSLEVAASLNHLGIVKDKLGDLRAAADDFEQALRIYDKLAYDRVDHLDQAGTLNNLGMVMMENGDLILAEHYLRKALGIQEDLAPGSLDVAVSLVNLGSVVGLRGDLTRAAHEYQRALAIQERLAPNSRAMAASLDNLGELALALENLSEAGRFYRRALVIRQKVAPGGLEVAQSMVHLGQVAMRTDDLGKAEAFFRQALAIQRDQAPYGLELAGSLDALAQLALKRADLETAKTLSLEALDIRRRLAPGSLGEATSHFRLATAHRRLGALSEAGAAYACAIEAVEAQQRKLGGSYEIKSIFSASQATFYRDYLDFLFRADKLVEAFHVLERFRTRAFLESLNQRDLSSSGEISPQLILQRRVADALYSRLLGEIARLPAETASSAREHLVADLQEARRQQEEIRAKIRAASPPAGAFEDLGPLDLEGVRQILDPGTLLLSYSIGANQSYLFAVGPSKGELKVFPLASDQEQLGQYVEQYRAVMRPSRSVEAINFHAQNLTEMLLAPATDQIRRAKRLLILPDGPLHHLPFAALMAVEHSGGSHHRYLIETKPLTMIDSATVFAVLKRRRRSRTEIHISAFGDPDYPRIEQQGSQGSPRLRALLANGFELDPLPATRVELEQLRVLFPRTSRLYLGAEATEEAVKSADRNSTVLHFACHGMIDEHSPLDSSLVLTLPRSHEDGQENGLLQAWEIFEQLRLDTDLVTLSACETALGKRLEGEGVLGLVRAFQYAGARSILASLWEVNDMSTASLMEHFYEHVKAGKNLDEALRRAQKILIQEKASSAFWSHPFYWAAFRLNGDWR